MIILGSLNLYTPNHKYQPQYDQVMIVIIIILRPLNFYTSRWVWWQWSCCNWETTMITRFMAQHGAHLGPTGPRWAPCWPHAPCYLRKLISFEGISHTKTTKHALIKHGHVIVFFTDHTSLRIHLCQYVRKNYTKFYQSRFVIFLRKILYIILLYITFPSYFLQIGNSYLYDDVTNRPVPNRLLLKMLWY